MAIYRNRSGSRYRESRRLNTGPRGQYRLQILQPGHDDEDVYRDTEDEALDQANTLIGTGAVEMVRVFDPAGDEIFSWFDDSGQHAYANTVGRKADTRKGSNDMAIYKDRNGNRYREAAPRRKKPGPSSLSDLTDDQASALRDYAEYYGDQWRDRLDRDWMRGGSDWENHTRYPYLHQIRNKRGPRWLRNLPEEEVRGGPRGASLRRQAGKKKSAQDERQPGQVSATLRRRMGDALADIFDEFGPEIYSEAVLGLKDVILERFKEGFEALDGTVKDELGRRGIEESRQHVRAWSNEIVEDVNHMGLDEVAGALEDYVSTLTAEYQQPEEGEGDDLLEVADEDLEAVDVEEVAEEDVEPAEGEEEGAEGEEPEEISFEELGIEMPTDEMAASFGPLGGRRRRPSRRRFRREAAGRRHSRDV